MKYDKRRERSKKRTVFFIPEFLQTVQTVEKQGRYSMAKAVKEMRAGKDSRAFSSFGESISNTNIRFSFAKNPVKREAENGAFPNPRGAKRKENSFPNKKRILSVSFSVK